jgi:hypothetical protein
MESIGLGCATRHVKGLPSDKEELARLRALAGCYYVLIKLHLFLCRSREDRDNVMSWKDEALGAPMRKKLKLLDDHRYTDLSGQAKCLIGTNSLTHEKYKYALKNHPKTMQDLGEYSVLTRFLMCPGGKWKDSTWAEHKAAMLSAGLNEAGMKKYNLNEANMCLHFGSRLEARSLWVAQFDEAVKTSGYDFSGIGSPYDTKKRTANGTGAGGENNFAVGKAPSLGQGGAAETNPVLVAPGHTRDSLWLDKQPLRTTQPSSISMPLRPPTGYKNTTHNGKKNGLPVMREMSRNGHHGP